MGIRFYCGVNETKWNYYPVSPGDFACVSPVMGASTKRVKENVIFLPDTVKEVIVDSGAFCDGIGEDRKSFDVALYRQLLHIEKYNYQEKVSHIASYDLLIDEKWTDNNKRKKDRWSSEEADAATQITIDAVKYISKQRDYIHKRLSNDNIGLVLSAQGVTKKQYLHCAEEIAHLMEENDIFGLGGWCILGIKRGKLLPSFREIMLSVIPYVANKGIKKVHIWGMMYPLALGELYHLCGRYNLSLSLDSSGPQKRPIFGVWGYGDWKDKTNQ